MLAWHWVRDDLTLRDGRPLVDGEKLAHDGPLKMCESGLHASEKILDALQYAPGATCCRVDVGGEMLRGTGKIVVRERTCLWHVDATDELRAFARWCALRVLHLWDAPDVVRQYLETGDESLRAAAGDAARAAAGAAAGAAARAAAWAAAWDVTWAAARDAARAAAGAAARIAVMASAGAEQSAELERRVMALHEAALHEAALKEE